MTNLQTQPHWQIRDLQIMAYAPALALQRELNLAVSQEQNPRTLLLVEHPPVITVSHRKSAAGHLLANHEQLAKLGIAVHETDRGGDITYHGPGQLVVYPILRLGPAGLNLGRYMRLLENIVINVLQHYNIHGHQEQGATGVWVHRPDQLPAKICAMGVRIRKNTTMHGLALNVTTDLSHFSTIVPCGLAGREPTSLAAILGKKCPSMAEVKQQMIHQFQKALP